MPGGPGGGVVTNPAGVRQRTPGVWINVAPRLRPVALAAIFTDVRRLEAEIRTQGATCNDK